MPHRMIPVAPAGAPAACPDPIAWAGTIHTAVARWRVAAGHGHHHELEGARRLTAEDQRYVDGLARQWRRGLTGRRWARPEPLRDGRGSPSSTA